MQPECNFFRLVVTGGSPRENPLAAEVWRRQRNAAQLGMLGAALLFISFLVLFGKGALTTRSGLAAYLLARVTLAEFFWIWMAADHLFSTLMSWRRRRALEEVRATPLTALEIARGFIGPTLAFLFAAHSLHCLADMAIPYGRSASGWASSKQLEFGFFSDLVIWRVGLTLGLWFSGFATLAAASTWCFREAATCPVPRVHAQWFLTLCRLGIVVFGLDCLGLFFSVLAGASCSFLFNAPWIFSPDITAKQLGLILVFGAVISGYLKFQYVAQKQWRLALEQMESGEDGGT